MSEHQHLAACADRRVTNPVDAGCGFFSALYALDRTPSGGEALDVVGGTGGGRIDAAHRRLDDLLQAPHVFLRASDIALQFENEGAERHG
ncbi:hypothetical protein [Paraburkholderia sp. BR14374]|uniref:hypothetical protein n=1 Tax=Paraburkholderia sp. BR14374 TaxID=3237007 RepID=UPI0034CD60F0